MTTPKPKYIFFVHGYPNGPSMFKSYIDTFTQDGFQCVALNFRTGISLEDNVGKLREVIESYPIDSYKVLMAHDYGAAMSWLLLSVIPNIVDVYISLSISHRIRTVNVWNDGLEAFKLWYQFIVYMWYLVLKLPVIGNFFVEKTKSFTDGDKYFTGKEGYVYAALAPTSVIKPFLSYNKQLEYNVLYSKSASIPTLLIRGTKSSDFINDSLFVDKEVETEFLKLHPNNKSINYTDSGHFFLEEKEKEVLEATTAFINVNFVGN